MNQGDQMYPAGSLSSDLSDGQLSRTNSMPSGMNTIEGPVQLRLHAPRSSRKAQYWRNSVAVTNSDYQSQWRSQLSPLVRVHGSGAIAAAPSAPSLDTISEYEMRGVNDYNQEQFRPPHHYARRSEGVADPNMFRYTPTPAMDPSSRQRVSAPLSRPTTPQIGSAGFARPASLVITSPPPSASMANTSFLRNSSQAIHISAAAANQFLPLFLNPETGNVYMFEDGYYIPVPAKNVEELERATNINGLTKPPTPVRNKVLFRLLATGVVYSDISTCHSPIPRNLKGTAFSNLQRELVLFSLIVLWVCDIEAV